MLRAETKSEQVARHHNSDAGAGYWRASNVSSGNIAGRLERYFKIPVIDRTGLTGRYDINLKWDEPDEQHRNPETSGRSCSINSGLSLFPAVSRWKCSWSSG